MSEPRLTRGGLLATAGLGLASMAGLATGCTRDDPAPGLRVLFATWVSGLHPAAAGVGALAGQRAILVDPSPPADFELAAMGRSGAARPRWDLFVGLTPFADLTRLVERSALEAWDDAIPAAMIADLHPRVRDECTLDGRLYVWPFVVDIVVQGWNSELVARAGIDPAAPPASFDELVRNARTVVRAGAAPFGCTFDPRPWRSLVPIAAALGGRVPSVDGLVDLRSDEFLEALEILIQLREVANPDVLDARTTPGAGITADEGVFGAQTAAYYVKYQNAHVRLAATWADPSQPALAALPSASRATVFWSSGLVRLTGRETRTAARYADALTSAPEIWRTSLAGGRLASGQLPARQSLFRDWHREKAHWLPTWADRLFEHLDTAHPIPAHKLGAQQFTIAQPWIERALLGDETPKCALATAMARVRLAARKA